MKALFNLSAALFFALILQACDPGGWPTPNPLSGDAPSRGDLTRVAQKALIDIQQKSIDENLEYCGVIIKKRNSDELIATEPLSGGAGWCQLPKASEIPELERGDLIVGDYHTHAGYDSDSDSEVPSVTDMVGNGEFGIPGFVSTPGGRLWYVQEDGLYAEQVCGTGCLYQDEDFKPESGRWKVKKSYTLRQMLARQS